MFPDEEGTETCIGEAAMSGPGTVRRCSPMRRGLKRMKSRISRSSVRGSTMFPDEEGTETTYFRMRTPKSSVVRRCSPMRRGLKLVGALIGPLPAQPGSTMFPGEEGTETEHVVADSATLPSTFDDVPR